MQNILVLNEGLPKTYHDKCYGNVKVFITLVANDWNPHYIPYAQNELVMTNHQMNYPRAVLTLKYQCNLQMILVRSLNQLPHTHQIVIQPQTKLYKAVIKLNHKTHQIMMLMLMQVLCHVLIQGQKSLNLALQLVAQHHLIKSVVPTQVNFFYYKL